MNCCTKLYSENQLKYASLEDATFSLSFVIIMTAFYSLFMVFILGSLNTKDVTSLPAKIKAKLMKQVRNYFHKVLFSKFVLQSAYFCNITSF